jgi:lysophospholipase L1-like esterase
LFCAGQVATFQNSAPCITGTNVLRREKDSLVGLKQRSDAFHGRLAARMIRLRAPHFPAWLSRASFQKPKYDPGDHLHLTDAGYKAMADSIDLAAFKRR